MPCLSIACGIAIAFRMVAELEEKKNGPSDLIPRDEKKGAECMHADVCRGYRANFMTYRLPRMSTGYIKVCCVNWGKCGEKLAKALFYIDDKQVGCVCACVHACVSIDLSINQSI